MLARTPKAVCLECGLPWISPAFTAHAGIRKRKADRTFVAIPLDCPVDVES